MQTEINSALQIAFSRHVLHATPSSNRSPFSSPPVNTDKIGSAIISELPYRQGNKICEGRAPKRRLSFSSDHKVQDLTGVRRLEMK
jgi:hypothetical protein